MCVSVKRRLQKDIDELILCSADCYSFDMEQDRYKSIFVSVDE